MLMQGQHWWIWTFGSKRRERRRVRKRMCVIQCIIIGCICLINLTVLICYYKWSTGEGFNWTLTLEFTAQYIIFLSFSSHTTTNMVCQLRQLYLRLFWKRHSMVQLQFASFHWDSLYLKGQVLFFQFIDLFTVINLLMYALLLSFHRLRSNVHIPIQLQSSSFQVYIIFFLCVNIMCFSLCLM